MSPAGQSAVDILKKYGIKPNKSARARVAVEQAVKDRAKAKRQVGVDPAGAIAQQRAVENDNAAQERTHELVSSLNKEKPQTGSRADLMNQAKERGIKYFRILSKSALTQVLAEGVHPDKVKALQDEAIWKWRKKSFIAWIEDTSLKKNGQKTKEVAHA